MNDNIYWKYAQEAGQKVGWFPTVIFAQWQWETADFTSNNLQANNNIAGQTWTPQYSENMKGSPRPESEGGFYVRYDSPVDGYVDFIQRNPRYAGVKDQATEEYQIREIARQGWAADPNYADELIGVLCANREKGYTIMNQDMAKFILDVLSDYWKRMDGNDAIQAYTHSCSNELRLIAGIPQEQD